MVMSPKLKIFGFGSLGHVRKSPDHENEGFHDSAIMNPKSYQSKMKQNDSMELSGYSFFNNCG